MKIQEREIDIRIFSPYGTGPSSHMRRLALLYWRSVGAGSGPPPRAMRAMRAPGNGNAGKPSPIASHTSCADIPHSPASRSIFSYRVAKPDSAAWESGASSMRAHSLPVFFRDRKGHIRAFARAMLSCAMPPSCLFHTQLNWVLEFCGAYSLSAGETRSARKRAPITNTAFLKSYVENCTGERGIAEAQRALRYVEDGSESPRETMVALLLDLPARLGGCGDPPPKMNYAIPLPKNARKATGRRSLRCDLLWPEEKLAIEYDSDLHHTGSERKPATQRAELS